MRRYRPPGGRPRLAIASTTWILLVTHAAWSQESADSLSLVRAEPIAVTIVRDSLTFSDVPYAVTLIRQDRIQLARPGHSLEEALRGVPGVQVDNRFNDALGERISIRGLGARSQFGVRGVKVVVDGIPATLADGQTVLNHVDLGSLGRVEMIRGPSSALYGNASGGVLRLETQAPSPLPVWQEFRTLAGSHGLYRVQSTTSGTEGPGAYLVSVARQGYGGHRDFSDADNTHINGTARYETSRNVFRVVVSAVDYEANNPGSLTDSLLSVDRDQAFSGNVGQDTREEGTQGQVGATWTRGIGEGAVDVGAYLVSREIDNSIPPRIIDLDRLAGGVRVAARSRVGGVRWTVGLDIDLQRDQRRNHVNDGGSRGDLTLDQDETVTGLGFFGQVALPVADRIRALAGIRYDRVAFDVDDRLVGTGEPDDSGERTMDQLSPSAGIVFRLGSGFDVYANVSTAFETPTTSELANRATGAGGFNPNLKPQRSVGFEVGGRGGLGRQLTLGGALYTIQIDEALIAFQVPDVQGRDFFRNAGSTVHTGGEIAVDASLGRGASVQAAYTWVRATFDEFATPAGDFADNEVPGVTPHRMEVIISIERPSGWYTRWETRVVSRMAVDDANTAHSPGHGVTDVLGGYRGIRLRGVEVSPFFGVTNVFDKEYNASVTVNSFGGRYFEPGPGRAGYGGIRIRFGRPREAPEENPETP